MASSADILIDDDHRERCVQYAPGLLGLRRPRRLPYSVVKKIAPRRTPTACRSLHADNRAALLERLKDHAPGVCLFVGGDAHERNDTDHEELFRQESYFQYLFGVAEPGWFGTVALPSGKATLFAPELGPEYAVWMGKIATREELGARYGVEVKWTSALAAHCATFDVTYAPRGVNSDSGNGIHERLPPPDVPNLSDDLSVPNALFLAACEARVFKSADEAALYGTPPG
ncbi:manganese ion binding protein [Aureococcus anophagefferens]|nr:manganese ion binding protein [Aureococcus anophagefferens]